MATEAGVKAGSTPLVCCLCQSKYHESCNLEMDDNSVNPTDPNLSFCGHECRQLYNNLQKLVGVKHELDSGVSWGIIHRSDVSLLSQKLVGRGMILNHINLVLAFNTKGYLYNTPFSCGFQPSSTICIWFIIKF
ncbi:hypothetical protein HanPI659440_Chr06g0251511 [Helianthus annuus]|nr:hypothetical protein HanPI659440_Chr06g0251511 [Helianthus annuus]